MKHALRLAAALAVIAVPAAAQDQMMAGDHTDPVTSITKMQDQFMGWIVAASEQVPASAYDFQPTPEIRTFSQLFGHVANSNFMFCAGIKDEKDPNTSDFEKATRAEVIAGLKAAKSYCDDAATFGAAHHHDARTFFGTKGDVTWLTAFNATHNAEHYGNIVTYMRLKGMTPPSSQGS